MQTISIHVPSALAYSYEHANEEKKAEQYINAWLLSFLKSPPANERLCDTMQQATIMNGLTDEKLNELQ